MTHNRGFRRPEGMSALAEDVIVGGAAADHRLAREHQLTWALRLAAIGAALGGLLALLAMN